MKEKEIRRRWNARRRGLYAYITRINYTRHNLRTIDTHLRWAFSLSLPSSMLQCGRILWRPARVGLNLFLRRAQHTGKYPDSLHWRPLTLHSLLQIPACHRSC